METGELIRKYRKKAGMTQGELARKCSMSLNTIYRYEAGGRKPRADDMEKIAKALHVTIKDLYDNTEKETDTEKEKLIGTINSVLKKMDENELAGTLAFVKRVHKTK